MINIAFSVSLVVVNLGLMYMLIKIIELHNERVSELLTRIQHPEILNPVSLIEIPKTKRDPIRNDGLHKWAQERAAVIAEEEPEYSKIGLVEDEDEVNA